MRLLRRMNWTILALGFLMATPVGAEQTDPLLSFVVSRNKAHPECTVFGPGSFVIQADRDIAALRIRLEPQVGESDAGRWTARLFPLPDTNEEETPRLDALAAVKPLWRVDRTLTASDPAKVELQAQVPRRTFRNWLLLLGHEGGETKGLCLRLEALPVDEGVRARQLMLMRSTYDPLVQKDEAREVIRHLTDDEVRYWTGFRTRRVFLTIWSELRVEDLRMQFPGADALDLMTTGHELPNGLELHTFTPK